MIKNNAIEETISYNKKSFYTPQDIIEKESQNEILGNLLLTWAGCYTKAYGHVVNNRILKDYVIIYCVGGGGWLKINEKQWIIKKGDFFVCPPNIPHSYGADNKDPWSKYWIHFRGRSASSYMNLIGISTSNPVIHTGSNAKILSWLVDIFRILSMGYTQSNLIFATSYLSNILSYISSLAMNSELNKYDNINIEKIITYMLDNISGNLNLNQLSDYASISRYHFVRVFKEKTGYSPMDYYIRLKIQKACELLESSASKINCVSSVLGFANPYYFSSTFKRIVGQSPKYYREMVHHH
ncbi:AraC family transcriptional regulator [Clostridium lacusfryxellense]|uniref:AraC family transcriptional regulator n=1 Tax=Clostridium lacusfryxellense TaxID=205328 RepID=UPI001C0BDE2E|nr:AraC family transcriptional regulator [Clostridium lacusfryxellense]MBU3112068.1 AraC family transcriptional regulator [Clostridium lacusfryxellense]